MDLLTDEEKEVLEVFRKLTPKNRYIGLVQFHATLEVEETARRLYGLPEVNTPSDKQLA